MVGICVIPGAGTGPLSNRPGGIASLILLLKRNLDPEVGAPLAPIPASGFAVMGVMPLREVLLGRVGKLTGVFAPEPRVRDKRALNEYAVPGHVKTVLAFQLAQEERDGVKGTLVTFAVRIWGVDAKAQRLIKLAWPVGNAFGGKFASAWLVALDRRLSPTS